MSGGKSGGGGSDNSAAMMQMMESMSSQQQQQVPHAPQMPQMQQQMPQQPPMMEMPSIVEPLDIDWTEKQDQLKAKAKADFNLDKARKKGRMETVLTSPLLDDEEVDVTSSILSGS